MQKGNTWYFCRIARNTLKFKLSNMHKTERSVHLQEGHQWSAKSKDMSLDFGLLPRCLSKE